MEKTLSSDRGSLFDDPSSPWLDRDRRDTGQALYFAS